MMSCGITVQFYSYSNPNPKTLTLHEHSKVTKLPPTPDSFHIISPVVNLIRELKHFFLLKTSHAIEPFLEKVVTSDEKRFLYNHIQ